VAESQPPDNGSNADTAALPPAGTRLPRSERRTRATLDAMRTLIRDLYLDRYGQPPAHAQEIAVPLQLSLTVGEHWTLSCDPPLPDQVMAALEDAEAGCNVYRPGHVHDFYEGSSASARSVPPTGISVFRGYDSMGVPQWYDLTQAFMEAGDERIDLLFRDPPATVARLQYGKELTRDQLRTFGKASKTYSVLAQVIAGYFLLPRKAGRQNSDRRLALTFQVVEARDADRRVSLHLNVLSAVPWSRLSEWFAEGWEPAVFRACKKLRTELEQVQQKVRCLREADGTADIPRVMRKIPDLLRRLAGSIERGGRQQRRRTRHVEQRRGKRPTHTAWDDARQAGSEQLFFDLKTDTWIAAGGHGRAHVYSMDGRHVTSFVLKPDAVGFRLRTRRWRPMTPEEIKQFKTLIQQNNRQQQAGTPETRTAQPG
jgi:hypothetical protein